MRIFIFKKYYTKIALALIKCNFLAVFLQNTNKVFNFKQLFNSLIFVQNFFNKHINYHHENSTASGKRNNK
ncbi:MAG: hypothetical protein CR989_00700 [Flavobacteriales bacterium]|nr:MAG: hypothetical protein CR989_00700 [Flavobacteriales bacterium]